MPSAWRSHCSRGASRPPRRATRTLPPWVLLGVSGASVDGPSREVGTSVRRCCNPISSRNRPNSYIVMMASLEGDGRSCKVPRQLETDNLDWIYDAGRVKDETLQWTPVAHTSDLAESREMRAHSVARSPRRTDLLIVCRRRPQSARREDSVCSAWIVW